MARKTYEPAPPLFIRIYPMGYAYFHEHIYKTEEGLRWINAAIGWFNSTELRTSFYKSLDSQSQKIILKSIGCCLRATYLNEQGKNNNLNSEELELCYPEQMIEDKHPPISLLSEAQAHLQPELLVW